MHDGMIKRSLLDRKIDDLAEPAGNKKIYKNDIAYNMMRMWQGAFGIAEEDCMVSPAYVVLAPKKDVCSRFFGYLFKLPEYLQLLTSHSQGLTKDRLRLYYKDFSHIPISLPGTHEQTRIADCLSSLDELIAAHGRKLKALKAYKKGLMQNLFPRPGKTQPRLRFPEFRDGPEWEVKELGKICRFVRGPFGGALKKEIFVSEGFAVYEQSHAIHKNLEYFRYFINKEKHIELKRFAVQPNDIIMSCSGTMGKFAILSDDPVPGVINQALLKLTVSKKYNHMFILTTLKLPSSQLKLLSQSAGGAIKNVVGVSQLKAIEVHVPGKNEQSSIANCIASLDKLISSQAQNLESLLAHKRGLMQQLFPSLEEES